MRRKQHGAGVAVGPARCLSDVLRAGCCRCPALRSPLLVVRRRLLLRQPLPLLLLAGRSSLLLCCKLGQRGLQLAQ